jgi:deoxyribose-phosphate aldolase
VEIPRAELAKMIDHTLLDPSATHDRIKRLCEEATTYGVHSVCVNPSWVSYAIDLLRGSDVMVCSTVGFPLGASLPEVKAFEAQTVVRLGAGEVDMVINIGALRSRDLATVSEDISQVVKASKGSLVKVIIETAYLTEQEKIQACKLAEEAGAAFVKTSTGFGPSGATVQDVLLMRKTVGDRLGVKAAGGIRTLKDALKMIEAGATRIGTSSAVQILSECPA